MRQVYIKSEPRLVQAAVEMFEAGHSVGAIARVVGRSKGSVSGWIYRYPKKRCQNRPAKPVESAGDIWSRWQKKYGTDLGQVIRRNKMYSPIEISAMREMYERKCSIDAISKTLKRDKGALYVKLHKIGARRIYGAFRVLKPHATFGPLLVSWDQGGRQQYEVAGLYNHGVSVTEIVDVTGVDRTSIYKWIKLAGGQHEVHLKASMSLQLQA